MARFAKAVPVLGEEAIGRPVLDHVGSRCVDRPHMPTFVEHRGLINIGFFDCVCLEPDNGACCLARSGRGQFPGKDVMSLRAFSVVGDHSCHST